MKQNEWNIGRKGHAWQGDEALERHDLLPESTKIEMHNGMLFWNDEERITVVAMLMENLGIDKIIPLIDPGLYLDALSELENNDEKHKKISNWLDKYTAQS